MIGAAGLAVGLALHGAMSNLAAGVMLLIFRPYKVDDFIASADQFGKVTEIDLFTTILQTFDNQQIIIPKDNAVATSGDYRNYFESEGQRFSHIIDPETGRPINHNLVSVTVISDSSMTADGLSTALMVMGVEEGLKFSNKQDIAALFIYKTENGFNERFTVKFQQYLK